jgi:hypothetical protein
MVAAPTNGTPLTVVTTATPWRLLGVSQGCVMSISGAASGLFSNWNARADLEDARNVAIDQATVAALQTHAPEIAAQYLDDDLPEPIERLLDRASAVADAVARGTDDASYVEAYREALARLLSPICSWRHQSGRTSAWWVSSHRRPRNPHTSGSRQRLQRKSIAQSQRRVRSRF